MPKHAHIKKKLCGRQFSRPHRFGGSPGRKPATFFQNVHECVLNHLHYFSVLWGVQKYLKNRITFMTHMWVYCHYRVKLHFTTVTQFSIFFSNLHVQTITMRATAFCPPDCFPHCVLFQFKSFSTTLLFLYLHDFLALVLVSPHEFYWFLVALLFFCDWTIFSQDWSQWFLQTIG